MSDLFSGTDLFSEFDRLQRQMDSLFGGFPSSIRSGRFGAFPQINIGTTEDSIEIVAFAPGLKLADLDVSIDKGLLTISGERKPAQGGNDDRTRDDARTYAQERFAGSFRRVIELPQNADPDKVQARYINGCLSISVGKREATKPRVITVQ
jgi:HSP20 family protein